MNGNLVESERQAHAQSAAYHGPSQAIQSWPDHAFPASCRLLTLHKTTASPFLGSHALPHAFQHGVALQHIIDQTATSSPSWLTTRKGSACHCLCCCLGMRPYSFQLPTPVVKYLQLHVAASMTCCGHTRSCMLLFCFGSCTRSSQPAPTYRCFDRRTRSNTPTATCFLPQATPRATSSSS